MRGKVSKNCAWAIMIQKLAFKLTCWREDKKENLFSILILIEKECLRYIENHTGSL